MPTSITKLFRFEAAHLLPNVPPRHKCARLHGHSFRVTVVVEGPVDPELGWVVDFADIERAWRPLHETLDHRYLNEIDGLENPTSEVLAKWIYDRFRLAADEVRVASVTVHETCNSGVTFEP